MTLASYAHDCTGEPQICAMQDVTVWVHVHPDGKTGKLRDKLAHIAADAREQVTADSDSLCLTCGWMGKRG